LHDEQAHPDGDERDYRQPEQRGEHRLPGAEVEVSHRCLFVCLTRFDDAVAQQLGDDPGAILDLTRHADYCLAVPTPDHFIPLLYVAALAAEEGKGSADALVRGYAMGSISMSCYGVGMRQIGCREASDAAGLPPNVPADQTNM
jgi:hypothetical protein